MNISLATITRAFKNCVLIPLGVLLLVTINAPASTVSQFDVLVATDNLTVIGTATIQGNAFSVGGTTFAVVQGNIAIGTDTPRGQLHAVGPVVANNSKSQFIWLPSSAALRVGISSGTEWDPANIGVFSIALGQNNKAKGTNSTILGGGGNVTAAPYSVISGGVLNTVDTAEEATIAGGGVNFAGIDFGATVGGGIQNIASDYGATVSGGIGNYATNNWATVPGGYGNTASGPYSFAAGQIASAEHEGSFVWADAQPAGGEAFRSSAPNEFKVRAQNGIVFYASVSSPTVIVSSGSILISTSATAAKAVPNIYISSANGNVGIGTSAPLVTLDVNGGIRSSSVSLTATGASIYSVTSSTGIHILNGRLKLEPGAYIEWPDGSVSVSSGTSGGGGAPVQVSSYTNLAVNTLTTSDSTFRTCIASNTIVLAAAADVDVLFTGSCAINAQNRPCGWSFLVDGAFLSGSGLSSTAGVIMATNAGANSDYNMNISGVYPISQLSAGSHTFCFTWARGNISGTASLCNDNGGGMTTICRFGVRSQY